MTPSESIRAIEDINLKNRSSDNYDQMLDAEQTIEPTNVQDNVETRPYQHQKNTTLEAAKQNHQSSNYKMKLIVKRIIQMCLWLAIKQELK
ncbi:hypothetical protein OnM2_034031 [Erysiphe neolycopersici]|uniref:Uncharacterized protein n=1 Tax=Erysiphe neolycopersici TaxID=212602 RepID=A0A420HY31_9PEZI|nr:hypothetical protein OnM2_034031 [Erysiphe neolycopersici]